MLAYLGASMCMSVEVWKIGPLSRVLHVGWTVWSASYGNPPAMSPLC